jgi:arsenate reductase
MAEAILNRDGEGKFVAYSAGSHPKGQVDTAILDLLERSDYPTVGLRSKSWDEFAQPEAPPLDFVFTVCDNAAGEACPVWPGQPMTAHWGVPDPAGEEDFFKKAVLSAEVMRMLTTRISLFTSLPLRSLDRLSLQQRLNDIGQSKEKTS